MKQLNSNTKSYIAIMNGMIQSMSNVYKEGIESGVSHETVCEQIRSAFMRVFKMDLTQATVATNRVLEAQEKKNLRLV